MNKKPDIESPHVAEGTIHAWLDGALSTRESAAVQSHVTTCATCSAAVAEARGFIAASTRILSALDDVPGEVIPRVDSASRGSAVETIQRRSRSTRAAQLYAPLAAAAVLAIVATLVIHRQPRAMREVIPASIQPPSDSTAVASRVSAAKPAIAPAQSQRSKPVDARAPEAVPSVVAGRTAEARRPIAAALKSRVTDAAAADVATTKSQVVAAPQAAAAPPAAPVTAAGVAQAHDSLTITGRVTAAATGLPLASATINVVGTGATAVTDSTGTFTINNVPAGMHVLQARRVGFAASSARVTVPPDNSATVAIALPATPTALSEVVVTGEATVPAMKEFTNTPPVIAGTRVVSSGVSTTPNELVRQTVYELESGTKITLMERRLRAGAPSVARLGSTVLTAPASVQESHSVSWRASDGTMLTISGPLTPAQLEALKNQVAATPQP